MRDATLVNNHRAGGLIYLWLAQSKDERCGVFFWRCRRLLGSEVRQVCCSPPKYLPAWTQNHMSALKQAPEAQIVQKCYC